ncbi:MAG: hypothetical protein OXR66_06010 [Candidatus Woesearchaeota archaeon]|nr:hypothetical protein [Candidatus Woesearchaeota archaeon]
MNKNGSWIQIPNVVLFLVLILFTLILLFLEKDELDPVKTGIEYDLAHQKTNAVLMNVLKQPVQLEIAGTQVQGTVADAIVLGETKLVERAFHDGIYPGEPGQKDPVYKYTLTYPNGTAIEYISEHYDTQLKLLTRVAELKTRAEASLRTTEGNVAITFVYADQWMREEVFDRW